MQKRDPRIADNALYDQGDMLFNRYDTITNRVDWLSEFDLSYRERYGLRVSAAAWFDAAYDSHGSDTSEIVAFLHDITERKRAEELRASNDELERFNRAMVGRELRMIELKQEINELCCRLGEPPLHATDPLQTDSVLGAGPAPAPPGGGGA